MALAAAAGSSRADGRDQGSKLRTGQHARAKEKKKLAKEKKKLAASGASETCPDSGSQPETPSPSPPPPTPPPPSSEPESSDGGHSEVDLAALKELTTWIREFDDIMLNDNGEDKVKLSEIRTRAVGVLDSWVQRWEV